MATRTSVREGCKFLLLAIVFTDQVDAELMDPTTDSSRVGRPCEDLSSICSEASSDDCLSAFVSSKCPCLCDQVDNKMHRKKAEQGQRQGELEKEERTRRAQEARKAEAAMAGKVDEARRETEAINAEEIAKDDARKSEEEATSSVAPLVSPAASEVDVLTSDDDEMLRRIREIKRRSMSGGMEIDEYYALMQWLEQQEAMHLLVFGLGYDSEMLAELNKGGSTHFLEDSMYWVHTTPIDTSGFQTEEVHYNTTHNQVATFLADPFPLQCDTLEGHTCWDAILVDGPQSGGAGPGRQMPLFTAAQRAEECLNDGSLEVMHIWTHDNHRPLEDLLSRLLLGPHTNEIGQKKLRHFELRRGYHLDLQKLQEELRYGLRKVCQQNLKLDIACRNLLMSGDGRSSVSEARTSEDLAASANLTPNKDEI